MMTTERQPYMDDSDYIKELKERNYDLERRIDELTREVTFIYDKLIEMRGLVEEALGVSKH